MMRDDEQIDVTQPVRRTHQLDLVVPREIAEMERAEAPERDVRADRLGVLPGIRRLWRSARTVRVRPAGSRDRGRGQDLWQLHFSQLSGQEYNTRNAFAKTYAAP